MENLALNEEKVRIDRVCQSKFFSKDDWLTRGINSTLSSVYVTTESHEKRMRVADQCALRFAGSFTL